MEHSDATLPRTTDHGGPPQPAASAGPLARGVVVGRYAVLYPLGAGAMGMVYAAYDPKLDRKIALKVLKLDERAPEQARRRLLREAQALARLHHPNVVAVHDVGLHEGSVFVAMELVTGRSLRAWLDEAGGRRHWREVVEVFRQAALGLSAAHAVGLVHRDFKPDNAMIDSNGRVCVLDFGLARAVDDPAAEAPSVEPEAEAEAEADAQALARVRARMAALGRIAAAIDEPVAPSFPAVSTVEEKVLGAALTRHGAVVGTPAYMSPEQLCGGPLDARSDQFSLCVAMFEALFGVRPFSGPNLPALMVAIGEGAPQVPTDVRVPGWLQRLVLRGLAVEPERRHADLAAIARELAAASARPRRTIAAVAAALLLAGGFAAARLGSDAACTGAAEQIGAAWGEGARARIHAGLAVTAVPYAAATAERVAGELSAYAAAWESMHEDACHATHTRHEQSDELLDLRMACLVHRREALAALVEQFAAADAATAERAVEASQRLPAIADCGDLPRLIEAAPPPGDANERATFDGAHAAIARATAAQLAGKHEQGLAAADEALVAARTIEHDALAAEAGLVRARLLEGAGRWPESADALREAEYRARAAGDDRLAAAAEVEAVFVIGYRLARLEEGRWWAAHARGAVEHTTDLGLAARLDNHLGVVLHAAGELEAALEHLTRALATRERVLGHEHTDVAESHYNVAIALRGAGRLEEARAEHEHALGIRERLLGPDHPQVAESRSAIAVVDFAAGRHDAAVVGWTEAERIQRAAYGPGHPKLARTLNNLASAAFERDDFAAAERYTREALAIVEPTAARGELFLSLLRHNLGKVSLQRGDVETAVDLSRRAAEDRLAALGPEHPDVALSFAQLGHAELAKGELGPARAALERAIPVLERHAAGHGKALARAREALAVANR